MVILAWGSGHRVCGIIILFFNIQTNLDLNTSSSCCFHLVNVALHCHILKCKSKLFWQVYFIGYNAATVWGVISN